MLVEVIALGVRCIDRARNSVIESVFFCEVATTANGPRTCLRVEEPCAMLTLCASGHATWPQGEAKRSRTGIMVCVCVPCVCMHLFSGHADVCVCVRTLQHLALICTRVCVGWGGYACVLLRFKLSCVRCCMQPYISACSGAQKADVAEASTHFGKQQTCMKRLPISVSNESGFPILFDERLVGRPSDVFRANTKLVSPPLCPQPFS